jgi:hypothetical protein
MAASGFTPLSLYYSATTTNAPTAGNLVNGELAINIIDGKLFYKDNSGVVQVIATKSATSGIFLGTGAITVPAGTTAQEPTGVQGMLRFNTTTTTFEGYNGTVWGAIGGGGGGSTFTRTDFTATAGQTVFTVSYTVGNIDVYRNGIKLGIADFTATSGTSITLATGALLGDLIETMSFTTISIASTVSTFSGGTTGLTPATASSGAITLAGTLAIANGGTNSTATATAGGAAYGTGSAYAVTAAGTSGNALISAGAAAPAFGALAIGTANTNISGARTPTNGGTGVATLSGIAFGNGTSAFTAASTAQIIAAIGTATNFQVNSLGVGTAGSGTAGEIRATNNITAYYSDDRFKTNLGNIPNALFKVNTLNGFYYEANELAQSYGYEIIKEVGVSAQQVQAIMPEVVAPAPIDSKYLTVRYERLVPLLIEAIKELSAKVDRLEATQGV